jgi:hypothetical protein
MTQQRTVTLEVGFESGRHSQDAMEHAYERLLPLVTGAASRASPPLLKGTCHDSPGSTTFPTGSSAASRHLRPGLVRSAG